MWLVIMLIAALIATTAWMGLKERRNRYKLGFLALMLYGASIMILVDRAIAVMEGEPLIEFTTDGLIESGTVLGLAMLIPILLVWLIALAFPHHQPRT
ncbi:MAG: hypothetical protein QXG98_01015 [Candidatus Micrarchaeia archaeon]